MKTTAHFRLSKQTKRLMATLTNNEQRNHFKNMMISGESIVKTYGKKKEENGVQ